jgi:hypothetical protein
MLDVAAVAPDNDMLSLLLVDMAGFCEARVIETCGLSRVL